MRSAKSPAILAATGLVVIGVSCLAGCDAAARREELAAPYPLDRARAAVRLAEAGDAQAVDLLIDLLEDQDRGVRMFSILALERLCGETYGYVYYDAEPQRTAAVARWRAARQRDEVRLKRPQQAASSQKPQPPGTGEPDAGGAEPDQMDERAP